MVVLRNQLVSIEVALDRLVCEEIGAQKILKNKKIKNWA